MPLALSVALIGAVLGAAPATATTTTTVPWAPGSTPSGVGLWSNACTSSADLPTQSGVAGDTLRLGASPTLVRGADDNDPAWQLRPDGAEVGPSASVAGDLTGVRIDVVGPVAGRVAVRYGTNFGLVSIDDTTPGWHTVDLSATNLHWYKPNPVYLPPLNPKYVDWKFADDTAEHTLSEFATQIAAGTTALLAVQLGCSSAPVSFDHFQVARTAGTTDYDFTNPSSTTTLTASSAQIASGKTVTLTGRTTDSFTRGTPRTGAVQLQAAPVGGPFAVIAERTGGSATFTLTPPTTTRYRLAYTGSTDTAASMSAPVTVQIKPVVTAKLSSASTVLGRTYSVTGTTRPALQSVAVQLQRLSGGAWKKLATSSTDATGRFSFTRTAKTAGTQQLRVSLAAAAGNAAATSAPLRLTTLIPGTVSASAKPTRPEPGKKITVKGRVAPVRAGAKVTVQRKVAGTWEKLTSTTTTSTGRYAVAVKVHRPGILRLRARVASTPTITAATSPVHPVTVTTRTRTTARLRAARILSGRTYTITGRVAPHRRSPMRLQRKVDGAWAWLARFTTSASGRYTYSAAPTQVGTLRLRVVRVASIGYRSSRSAVLVLTVRPAPVAPAPAASSTPPASSGGPGVGHG